MDDRFKKIHESVDKIHDSYKATTQALSPEPPSSGGRKSRRNKRNSKRKNRQRA
jgi:hypothetical protein